MAKRIPAHQFLNQRGKTFKNTRDMKGAPVLSLKKVALLAVPLSVRVLFLLRNPCYELDPVLCCIPLTKLKSNFKIS